MDAKRILVWGLALAVALGCGDDAEQTDGGLDAGYDAGATDAGAADGGDAGSTAPDAGAPDAGLSDAGGDELEILRGRFTSGTPIRSCDEVTIVDGVDGQLVRATMDLCGDDIAALARTLVANLDALEALGRRGLVVLAQGTTMPDAWLARCETYALESATFVGDLCVPWDATYQADLRAALVDTIGPAVAGHAALAGVYFTLGTMTNGAEMHFRVERDSFPDDPGDATLRQSYLDVMDIFQEAFEVPILFEGGHCIWWERPGSGGDGSTLDCETPLALYRYTRDTYGLESVGVALWNCAERFWAAESDVSGTAPLLAEVEADGAALGCQTVGSFTNGACRFTDSAVGDYGARGEDTMEGCATVSAAAAEAACVDTMSWLLGDLQSTSLSPTIHGTWAENWLADHTTTGVYNTSAACRELIDRLAP